MSRSWISTAERVGLWIVGTAVFVAAIIFIVLALSRPSHAAELVLGPSPSQRLTRGGTASVTVSLPKPKPHVQVLSRVVARPVVYTRIAAVPKPVAPTAPAGSIQARLIKAWPGDDRWMLRTVACESGFDPQQVGGGGGNYYGLFQFGPWARAHYGNPLNMTVEQQALAAWHLLKDTNSGQWECSPYWYNP